VTWFTVRVAMIVSQWGEAIDAMLRSCLPGP